MRLEVVEVLALAGEGAGGSQHWSRQSARPRYSLSSHDVAERNFVHSFTCFDVAERVETDYDIVFAGRSNGVVVLWRMVTRNLFGGANKNDRVEETLFTASPHRGAVTCLTHTRHGTYGSMIGPLVFSGSNDQTVKVWNAWLGAPFKETCLQTLAEHRGGVTAVAFAGDTTLISTARDGSVRLWRPQRGRKLLRFPFFCCVKYLSVYPAAGGGMPRSTGAGPSGAFVDVWPTAICVTGGETWTLYCGDSDGTVSVFQRAHTSAAERLASTNNRSNSLAMEQLADSEVALCRRWAHLHSLGITGLVLVPEHNFLLSMGNDGICRILDYLQGNTFMAIENDHRQLFTSVAWDLAHEQLVLADSAGVVQIWNTYTESLLLKKRVATAATSAGPRKGQSLKALLGFHSSKADGMLYGMSPSEGCFFRWKMVKATGGALMGSHSDSIVGLAFQEKSSFTGPSQSRSMSVADTTVGVTPAEYKLLKDKLLVAEERGNSSSGSGALPLSRRGGEKRPFGQSGGAGGVAKRHESEAEETEEDGEEEVCFGLVLLSVSMDGVIKAWEMLGKNEKYCMRHPGGVEVTTMLVLPGGLTLVTGTDDGSVRFWRLETGAGESFETHENTVSALAACKDRQGTLILASACFEGTITIWRTEAKDGFKQDQIPAVHFSVRRAHGAKDGSDAEVLCLAFVAADISLLTSAGNDRVVRCWCVREHALVLLSVLEGHKDSIEALVADGLFLLSGSCDGAVRVWNISMLEHADSVSGENNAICGGESGQSCAMTVGVIKAHPSGIADLAIMANARDSCASLAPNGEQGEDVGGLLVTCGSGEGIVKIWDYTHVEEDGRCGRLITELHPHEDSFFNCVACTHDTSGTPLLFAGTNDGGIRQLALDDINADECDEQLI